MSKTDLPTRLQVGEKTVRIQQRLGNGAFGVVYKVIDEASSGVYALKDVLCLNDSALRNTVREVTTLNKISHENVIAVVGADQFRNEQGLHMLLLTEYCPGGSLNDRLARPSTEEENLKWMSQTAAAVAHLHSRGVVHRDLKADNVLLTANGDVKLGDFGLAREYIALKRTQVQQDDGSWITNYTQYYLQSGIGPIHWLAPEFFREHYTEKADVFSLGTLLFAILERDFIIIRGKAIYGAFISIPDVGKIGVGLAMERVDSNISIKFSRHAQGSNALQRVVLKTLKYNKYYRPSAQEVYNNLRSFITTSFVVEQNTRPKEPSYPRRYEPTVFDDYKQSTRPNEQSYDEQSYDDDEESYPIRNAPAFAATPFSIQQPPNVPILSLTRLDSLNPTGNAPTTFTSFPIKQPQNVPILSLTRLDSLNPTGNASTTFTPFPIKQPQDVPILSLTHQDSLNQTCNASAFAATPFSIRQPPNVPAPPLTHPAFLNATYNAPAVAAASFSIQQPPNVPILSLTRQDSLNLTYKAPTTDATSCSIQ